MSESIAFDRAADFYDETRGFPPGEEVHVGEFLRRVGELSADDRMFEVGIGTGRIALPLAMHVHSITGIDLARPMMERLLQKRRDERIHLVQGDATMLPFADNTFDAGIAVHIFHLIPEWKRAVAEVARVLKPDAPLVQTWTDDFHPQAWWDAWMNAVPKVQRARFGLEFRDMPTFLLDLGWQPRGEAQVYSYSYRKTPREFVDQLRNRMWSSTWDLPDEDLERGINAVLEVMATDNTDLDAPLELEAKLNARAYLPPK